MIWRYSCHRMLALISTLALAVLILDSYALAHGTAECGAEGTRFYLGVERAAGGEPGHRFGAYPLDVGSAWVYQHTYKSCIGVTADIITISWNSEIRIVEHVKIPQGKLVVRECTVSDVAYDYPNGASEAALAWFRSSIAQPHCNHYLLFESGYAEEIPPWGWEKEKRMLTDRMLEILERPDSADLTQVWRPPLPSLIAGDLPLLTDMTPGYWWRWSVMGEEVTETPFGRLTGAVHLLWMANGGGRHRYFKDGIGYIREWYKHGGSYVEEEMELVSFTPGGGEADAQVQAARCDAEGN